MAAIQMTTIALDKALHQGVQRYRIAMGMTVKGVINRAVREFLEREKAREEKKVNA